MPIVTLNLRDLQTGDRMLAEFETLDACVEWLRDRPQFVDVLGPVDEDISPEVDQMLRKALRPLDDQERALVTNHQQKQLAEVVAAEKKRRSELQAAVEEQMASLGPNDPMHVGWKRGGEVVNSEPLDKRAVPQVVVEAVLEWVAERDLWVHPRGERLREASLIVWPGDLPVGEERVQPGGQFETEPLPG